MCTGGPGETWLAKTYTLRMVLPIGDDNRDRRRRPLVTPLLVAINVVFFLYELELQAGSASSLQAFVFRWGVVPYEYKVGADLPPYISLPYWTTLITSLFLHGGWLHLLGNMLYLWIFGDNVEDRLGRLTFIAFYFGTGIVASFAQILADPASQIPSIGASGAISGVLGAYLVMFPRKRVRVLLAFVIAEVPAIVVIGLWALMQLLNGVGTLVTRSVDGAGVAYMAHVGGFLAGVVAALFLRAIRPPARRRPPRTVYLDQQW
ncbi:MAG: rhomboid family intramembrane serine protease [Pseudomonadota bacterium]